MIKRILLFSAAMLAFVLMQPSMPVHANTTTLNVTAPYGGPAGRPTSDAASNLRFEGRITREVVDCSFGVNYQFLSGTSTPINVTSVAGLDQTNSKYAGNYQAQIVNNGLYTMVAWVSMTPTAISTGVTQTGGIAIPAGASAIVNMGQRDGITLHLRSLTAITDTAGVSICTF